MVSWGFPGALSVVWSPDVVVVTCWDWRGAASQHPEPETLNGTSSMHWLQLAFQNVDVSLLLRTKRLEPVLVSEALKLL